MAHAEAKISFRPLQEADLPLLHEWLHRPHVAEWWGNAPSLTTLDDTRKKYLPRIAEDSHIKGYIASLEGKPLGFIQSYSAIESGGGWWEDETDPGVRGTDQFLGDVETLGYGLGAKMVSAFVTHLFEDASVTRVQTDPDPRNARAIRCYEKAGFRTVREVSTPYGPALLMVAERQARTGQVTVRSNPSLHRTRLRRAGELER